MHLAVPLQISSFITSKIVKSVGGRLTPALSRVYEEPTGKYQKQYGSNGHIATKAVDKEVEGVFRAGIIALFTSLLLQVMVDSKLYYTIWKHLTQGSAL